MNLVRKALRYELGMWRSLFQWIRHRPAPEREFGYAKVIAPILWTFVILSALEIPAMHLLLPWPPVRLVIDILGAYALLWMIGLMAGIRVHPHVLTEPGLRVRYGLGIDFTIPWSAVRSLHTHTRAVEKSRTVHVDGDVLSVYVAHQTSVEVRLREPVTLLDHEVTTVRLYADDADGLVKQVRAHLEAHAQRLRAR